MRSHEHDVKSTKAESPADPYGRPGRSVLSHDVRAHHHGHPDLHIAHSSHQSESRDVTRESAVPNSGDSGTRLTIDASRWRRASRDDVDTRRSPGSECWSCSNPPSAAACSRN